MLGRTAWATSLKSLGAERGRKSSPGVAAKLGDLGTRTAGSRTSGKSKRSSRARNRGDSLLPFPPTFVALRTANGFIFRVSVFSLRTKAVSLLPVPEVRDQSSNP